MVDSESICSGNVLVQSIHLGPQPRPQGVYLIMRGKTVVAKGLVFYISTYIVSPYSNPVPNPRPSQYRETIFIIRHLETIITETLIGTNGILAAVATSIVDETFINVYRKI